LNLPLTGALFHCRRNRCIDGTRVTTAARAALPGGHMPETIVSALYTLAAELMLVAHVLIATFIIGGLIMIYIGAFCGWHWIRNLWFQSIHLVLIGVVIAQSWLGLICPLTTWEMKLREHAGDAVYAGTFVSHWLKSILYYDAPAWVFTMIYSLFGLLVFVSWFAIRPDYSVDAE
jgi:hypothetical protein